MPELQPVTEVLEREVTSELRRRGIVFWLDRDGHYTSFVDKLADRYSRGDFHYPVMPFRGSFLETMLGLEEFGGGLDPTPVLVHLPGFTEDALRGTPLLEFYHAGYRHRRALDTAVREAATGRVKPADIEEFLASGDLTLEKSDDWLSRLVSDPKKGVAGLLERTSLEIVMRELLVKDTFLSGHLNSQSNADLDAITTYFERQIGMNKVWVARIGEKSGCSGLDGVKEALASWLLCVEYVDDLARTPHLDELKPLKELPQNIVKACTGFVTEIRSQHADIYEKIAERVEEYLDDELPHIEPEDLGRIDTFRIEDARVLEAAIATLQAGNWPKARDWSSIRTEETSFWIRRDQSRRIEWSLVGDAANLGCLLEELPRPFDGLSNFEDAITRYTDRAYEIDKAHRRFEQRRFDLLAPQLPHFAQLKAVVGELRKRYRVWADNMARSFADLCRSKGFLPDGQLQQRNFYDQVVHPLTQANGKTAVFVVDALRYEMATDLFDDLGVNGTKVELKARFAELPTITSVGMNVLAPVVSGGRLKLAGKKPFKGFSTGEFVVDDPEDRARAMGMRSIGERALLLQLKEVCETDQNTLRNRIAQKKLIVIHGREIDDAGEANVGLQTFEATLGQIRSAWHHLKAVGVKQFIFTSDHGFLLLDETSKTVPFGKKTDPNRRHILSAEKRQEQGMLSVSLSELGYDGADGFLLLREDTALFDTGGAIQAYAHGGNSPQERIIPVLTVTSKHGPNVDLSIYVVEAEKKTDAVGCRRIRLRLMLEKGQTTLQYVRSTPVDVAIRVPNRSDIRTMLRDMTGPGEIRAGRLQIPVGETWSELFFNLEGPEDDRAQIEIFHPDNIEQVSPLLVEGWFNVEGRESGSALEPPEPVEWVDKLPDDGTRNIFAHLHQHGVITESEAVAMLGSPRKFRRFSIRFDEYRVLTPLRVRIESTPEGKRYVREGKKNGS